MQVHRTTVKVIGKELITPNYLRIHFFCEAIEPFKDVPIGVNNKLFIPPQGHTNVEMPTFNSNTKKWDIANEANRPTVRTYTHRAIDLESKTLTVDFAIHEGDSIACNWAIAAEPQYSIGLAMKLAHRDVLPAVKEYLFVTDMTGIPVVASLVSTLPKDVKATVLTEVTTQEDIFPAHYRSDAELILHWLINAHPESGSQLAMEGKKFWEQLDSSNFSHITAEYSTVKELRDFLRYEKNLTKNDFFACAYWQIAKREDEEREKRLD